MAAPRPALGLGIGCLSESLLKVSEDQSHSFIFEILVSENMPDHSARWQLEGGRAPGGLCGVRLRADDVLPSTA